MGPAGVILKLFIHLFVNLITIYNNIFYFFLKNKDSAVFQLCVKRFFCLYFLTQFLQSKCYFPGIYTLRVNVEIFLDFIFEEHCWQR